MPTYVVRLWLPDRPGALGSVAGRIGAVRGDLVGIDILERGAGRAIDELVVELPEAGLVPLLVKELHEVDGVDVEEVRPVATEGRPDPRLAALETAATIVAQRHPADVLEVLAHGASREFECDWVAVADVRRGVIAASVGECPPSGWVLAFAGGVTATAATGDVAWASLATADMTLVVGRPGRALRSVERKQLAALAGIADVRWAELGRRGALAAHPSAI
ncbi:MAG TPA: hypothetical protein VM345_18235 [Acidimicrobiales bacterium]|nr:hypothetical protein [Acidimicrobiales bacterium]